MFAALAILATLLILGRAVRRNEMGARESLLGGLVLCLSVAVDLLTANRVLGDASTYYTPAGLFFFILTQSYVLARLFAAVYRSAQRLSRDLQERTLKLAETNVAIARFVPTAFLDRLGKSDLTEIQPGDQTQEYMTVLFTDIRSFTQLSETMTPAETFNFMNAYMRRMTPIVQRYNGFVDKYIGDAVVGIFGAPVDLPDHDLFAARASLDMLTELERLKEYWTQNNLYIPDAQNMKIRIGLNSGTAKVGFMGTDELAAYTMMGDTVNLAARLEAAAKAAGEADASFLGAIGLPSVRHADGTIADHCHPGDGHHEHGTEKTGERPDAG